MKTALTCALFGILFFGSQCSSEEGTYDTPMSQEELYKHSYENYTGLCGSWYRNESSLESIYNCTLKTLDGEGYPIVNKTWETFRHKHNLTIRALVGLMCNFSVAMPHDFYLMFEFEGNLEQKSLGSSDDGSVATEARPIPESELYNAEGNCSKKIYASTTAQPPISPSEPVLAME
uniref:Isac anti-complement n=1 Tax=Ixodes ricinus TaxID=34613 RepID=A0A0K8R975_IXORI